MTRTKLRFIVPHSLFSEGLINILAATGRYEVSEYPDILLVDVSMMSDDLIKPALDDNPAAKLIVIGRKSVPTFNEMADMIALGARAYVRDTMTSEMLYNIVDLVFTGNAVWPAEVLEGLRRTPFPSDPIMLPPPPPLLTPYRATLSPREQQLLGCLRQGMSNKHIAKETNIAEATVKVHVKAILRKLHLQNRTQAAVWMANNG